MNLCDSGWTARGATGLGTIVLTETSWICYPAWCTTTRIYRNQASMWRCEGYRIHQSRRLTRSWEAGLQGLAGKAPRKVAPDSQTASRSWRWMNPGFVCQRTNLREPEFWPARRDNIPGPWLSGTLASGGFCDGTDAAMITKPGATTSTTIAVRYFMSGHLSGFQYAGFGCSSGWFRCQ